MLTNKFLEEYGNNYQRNFRSCLNILLKQIWEKFHHKIQRNNRREISQKDCNENLPAIIRKMSEGRRTSQRNCRRDFPRKITRKVLNISPKKFQRNSGKIWKSEYYWENFQKNAQGIPRRINEEIFTGIVKSVSKYTSKGISKSFSVQRINRWPMLLWWNEIWLLKVH